MSEVLSVYGFENIDKADHYQVGLDIWVYLSESNDKKYTLILADYLDFEVFPRLLRLANNEFTKMVFVLQREISVEKNNKRKIYWYDFV